MSASWNDAVLTKMRGDASAQCSLANESRGQGIGLGSATCLTNRGDVIDVDEQTWEAYMAQSGLRSGEPDR